MIRGTTNKALDGSQPIGFGLMGVVLKMCRKQEYET